MAVKESAEWAVRDGLVPVLLVIGFVTAGVSAGQVYPRARPAAYGGFWAGVLGVAGLVLALGAVQLGPVPSHVWGVTLIELAIGAGLGWWTTLGYIWLRDRILIALPLALQSGGSLGTLYLFLVWPDVRADIGWVIVAIAPASFLFYTLFRDRPPLGRRKRSREQVPAVSSEDVDAEPDEPPGSSS